MLWQLGILALIALGIMAGAGKVEALIAQNATAKQSIQTCASNVDGLTTEISDINKAHDERMAQERARASAAEAALKEARGEAAKNRATALDLLSKQLPPGKNACDAARDLMGEYAKGRKK